VVATTVGNRILVFNGSLFASFGRSGKEKVHLRNIVYLCHDARCFGEKHVHTAMMLKSFSNSFESEVRR